MSQVNDLVGNLKADLKPVNLVPWHSEQLAEATSGQWFNLSIGCEFARVISDTRKIQPNDIFLALTGDNFDGHDFVQQAISAGATAVIVSRLLDGLNIPQLVVADTRLSLGHLGAYRRLHNPQLTVIALTGSSGKTTVKEMLGSILNQLAPTLVTRGNLNNDLGVPMMLLELKPEHRYAVMELGANHVGEIDYTSNMVQPQVAGVLNIGTAHMGEFGGRIGIANAKSEIFNHLQADGVAVLPAKDDFSEVLQHAAAKHNVIYFGAGGDVFAENVQLQASSSNFELVSPQGRGSVSLPFAGEHNIDNALAAASFALAINVPLEQIVAGLNNAVGAQGRLNFKQQGNWLIIDDTYNANPHAMRAAAQVLSAQAGCKIMVMGDIGELGDAAEQEHFLLGKDIAQLPIDAIFSVGEFAEHTVAGAQSQANNVPAYAFKNKADLLQHLKQFLHQLSPTTASLLFKGSRYTTMESLIAELLADSGESA